MARSRVSRNLALLATAAAWATAAAAEFRLVREEDFGGGAAFDPGFWRHETGFQRNREEQLYTTANVRVTDGALRIEARREETPNPQWRAGTRDWRFSRRTAAYTSGSIVSREPLHFGRVEIVARSPSGAGTWPAIWLLHEATGLYGEIDVFEAVGKHPDTVFAGVHYGREARTRQHRNDSLAVPGFEGRWHTHTLEWTPERIVVSLDGRPWFGFDPRTAVLPGGLDPLRVPMHLRINLALGGSWGGPVDDARLPARFDVRSIRIWRWAPGAGDAVAATPAAAASPAAQKPSVPVQQESAVEERTRAPMRWGR